jgi:hypothetical protein
MKIKTLDEAIIETYDNIISLQIKILNELLKNNQIDPEDHRLEKIKKLSHTLADNGYEFEAEMILNSSEIFTKTHNY